MAISLDALHVELIELIVSYLELADIAALRLVSQVLAAKASTGCFKRFFRAKQFNLTSEDLELFVEKTRGGSLCTLIQHCTLRGILKYEATALPEQERANIQRLLNQAFSNVKEFSPKNSFASVNLQVSTLVRDKNGELVSPDTYKNGREVWETAQFTFRVVMEALRESQVPVTQHFNVFGDVRGCALGYKEFTKALGGNSCSLRELFGQLTKLTARLSLPPCPVPHPNNLNSNYYNKCLPLASEATSETARCLDDILGILPTLADLQSLDLHWHRLPKGDIEDDESGLVQQSLHRGHEVASSLPQLQECRLRGFITSESELLRFLSAVRPSNMTLEYISLTSGTWNSIFQYLTRHDSLIKSYHLDDLSQGRLVHFAVAGSPKFPYLRHPDIGPSTLSRSGHDIKIPIEFRTPRTRALGSGEHNRWLKSKAIEFSEDKYDFVKLNTKSTKESAQSSKARDSTPEV